MNSITAIQSVSQVPSKLDKTETAVAANKLATARTINGTSFNGTSNITTSTWGTSRNITIGNSKKAVNGSADVSWSLSDIGAATSSHTHDQYITNDRIMDGAQAKIYLWSSDYIANNYIDYTATAAAAKKLSTGTTGSSTQPVYFSDGKPVATPSYFTRNTQGDIGWGSADNNSPVTVSAIAYWNGAYSGTSSNLTYCNRGAFGTIVTKNSGDYALASHTHSYLALSGGTLTGNLRLKSSSSNYGNALYFGDSSYCYIKESTDNHMYIYTSKGFEVEVPSSSYYINLFGGMGAGSLTYDCTAMMCFTNTSFLGNVDVSGSLTRSSSESTIGTSDERWLDIYSTRGSWNGSDKALKKDIKAISRNKVKSTQSNEVTSYDLYNYVKGTGAYTFKYRNTDKQLMGIIANEIPENIFNLVGEFSSTQEEINKLKAKQEQVLEVYNKAKEEGVYDSIKTMQEKHEELDMSYTEIKKLAEKEIEEEPVRIINAPAQVAMLQEVLSMALNKIDSQEETIANMQKQIDELLAK